MTEKKYDSFRFSLVSWSDRAYMKSRAVMRKICIAFFFPIIGMLLFTIPHLAQAQSIESAREKYESGDLEGALDETQILLEEDSENLKAQSLASEVELAMKKREAEALTERALVEINSRRFEEAYAYLERALILDPENEQARELYLSIHEVLQVEGESMEEMLERRQEELAVVEEEPVEEAPAEAEPAEVVSEREPSKIAREKPKPEPAEVPSVHRYDSMFIRGGIVLPFAKSNNLDYVDSSVTQLGIHLNGRYYFNFWGRRLGLSVDYIGNLMKLGGSEYVNFGTHRVTVSGRIRTHFFEQDYGRLTVGARLNYHLFLLNNREDHGVYNFTRLYGPSFGIFVEDPILYRFWKADFLRNVGFESGFNCLFLIGQGDSAPSSYELFVATHYDLKRYRFHLGYRRYSIRNSSVKETYNDLESGAGYKF